LMGVGQVIGNRPVDGRLWTA